VYFTKGEGFYDNYKSNQKLSKYGLENISIGGTNINRMDLIRQKWLDNKFYGVVSDLQGNVSQWNFNFGWIANQYYGEHFGKITHGAYLQPNLLPMEYYRNHSLKNEWSAYAKALYKLNQFEFFGDVQTRNIHYQTMVDKASPEENPDFDKNYSFMNPKVGANFLLENAKIYFSYANAHREPTRSDLVANSSVKSEQLHDFELGYTHRLERFFMTTNLFYMQYQNQLVLTGALNEVGAALHENVGSSFRRGLEIASQYKISQRWNLSANATFSQNKNLDYILNNELGFAHLGTTDIAFSPSYIGNLSINYQPNTHFSFTISNKWVSKQYINNTQTTEFELRPYQLSDFMASYQTLWKNTELSFFLLVNNFLNKPYTNYGADYGSPYYFAQARANFILGFNLKFD
jgi:iron complex outermembrane receptor protein